MCSLAAGLGESPMGVAIHLLLVTAGTPHVWGSVLPSASEKLEGTLLLRNLGTHSQADLPLRVAARIT